MVHQHHHLAEDEEFEGVEIGSYSDFGVLRDTIRDRLEAGATASRFPMLMMHSDRDRPVSGKMTS